MRLCGIILPGATEIVSMGLIGTVALAFLGEMVLAPVIDLAPEVVTQAVLTSWALTVILACAVSVEPLLRLVIADVVHLLDWTGAELDGGRSDWPGQRLAVVEPKDVDTVSTTDVGHNHTDSQRAPDIKLCKSHIIELSTVPVEDRYSDKDTWETFNDPDLDEILPEDEDISLAARQETAEPEPAQVFGCLHLGQTHCLLFSRWPLEIRILVYHNLMVVSYINNPDRLVEDRLTTLVTSKAQRALYKTGIDTTVLRTCRQVYMEALPMLYGENNFVFFSPSALDLFRNKGLVGIPDERCGIINVPSFNFGRSPQGRLSLIRKLTLVLTDTRDDRWVPRRPSITEVWSDFLHESRFEKRVMHPIVDFPALDDLTLDFTDWALSSEEEIVVRPFAERLRPKGSLRRLCIKGVTHQASLLHLRDGLLQLGGRFGVN